MPNFRSSRIVGFVLASAALVPATVAHGQTRYTWGGVSRNDYDPATGGLVTTVLCDIPLGPPFIQRPVQDSTCGVLPVLGRTQAAAEFGGAVRTRALVSAAPPTSLFTFTTVANAEVGDAFTFAGLAPSRLEFEIALTGDPAVSVGPNSTGNIFNSLNLNASTTGERAVAFYTYRSALDVVEYRPTAVLSAPVIGSTVSFSLFMNTAAELVSAGFPPSASGVIDANFLSTGRIVAIRAFDAEGRDAFGRFTVTSASGAAYPFQAVIPEPSAYVLLAAGLGGVGVIAHRRRRVQV